MLPAALALRLAERRGEAAMGGDPAGGTLVWGVMLALLGAAAIALRVVR